MLSMFGVSKEDFLHAKPKDKEVMINLFRTILPIKPRRPGIFIDEKITNPDMTINYNDYNIEDIKLPFLIMHAKDDPMALYSHMLDMVSRLQDVKFVEYDKGGHVLFGHGEKNRQMINDFIRDNDWLSMIQVM